MSQLFTAFWGIYAVGTAQYGASLGSLIVAVNKVGSYFYGAMLGIFVLAFFFPRVGATQAFTSVLIGEAAIIAVSQFTNLGFLWYNVVGPVAVVSTGLLLSVFFPRRQESRT
jgi:hypothetical protein